MSLQRDARARAANQSALVRLLYDREGDIRTTRIFVIVMISVALIVAGTVAVSFAGAIAGPETLVIGALIVFVALKLPFLTLIFWIIMRTSGPTAHGDWSDRECAEILQYLATQVNEAKGKPDEALRLQWLTREAWTVAETVPDEHRAEAVALAVEISGLRPTLTGSNTAR